MAKQMSDIALDDNEDLDISSGDFKMTESTAQHQRQLVLNNKGDFKEFPTSCVGVFEYFDDEQFQGLIRAVSIEFCRDGMDVSELTLLPNGTMASIAVYR